MKKGRHSSLANFVAAWLAAMMVLALAVGVAWAQAPGGAIAGGAAAGVPKTTAYHPGYAVLQKDFTSGSEVTKACLTCHTNAAAQIHETKHWNWEFANPRTGQQLGKKHVINNYYVSLASNVESCTACHISTGANGKGIDFASEASVDCLVCHDATGDYIEEKFHAAAADCLVCHDARPRRTRRDRATLGQMAQQVGRPGRRNCGTCHFRDGGGDGVKHGDMDSSLIRPDAKLDVHMDAKGLDFSCVTCHHTDQHAVSGSRYAPKATDPRGINVAGGSRATCQSCHGIKPHGGDGRLDQHTRKLACQTCHIPTYARGGIATKLSWDWSTAGQQGADGKPLVKRDAKNRVAYTSYKGDFTWAENVVPEYVWFNGEVTYTLLGDKIDPSKPVPINAYLGGPDDPGSRVWPVKVFRGRQPYDKANDTLVVMHLAGDDKDAYWRSFDWNNAVDVGMKAVGVPFSGQLGFVETRMLWPITHMVAPAKEALACAACHAKNGRLAHLPGLYLAGSNADVRLDLLGLALVMLTGAGIAVHALARVVSRLRRG